MSKYTKEISQEEIKSIVSSSRSCKFDPAGCILEAKFGKVLFNLSQFKSIETCHLHLRRMSGNGKVLVQSAEAISEITVLSKITQDFVITTTSANIEISRPDDGLGEVCILGLTIGYNYQEEDTPLSYSWKNLISKCGKYSCLRMIDGRLFASEGAFIEGASVIQNIETTPPGMAIRDGDKIKFTGICEVVNLIVDSEAQPKPITSPFIHREGPTPFTNDTFIPTINNNPKNYSLHNSVVKMDTQVANNIIYDSNTNRGLKTITTNNKKSARSIHSNGIDYVLLSRGGAITIPIASLEQEKDYIVVLICKKLNGNGRINVGFCLEDLQPASYTPVLVENAFNDKYVNIATGKLSSPGVSFKIHLTMLDDGVGEVLISRIMLVKNLPINMRKPNSIGVSDIVSDSYPRFNLTYNDVFGKKNFVIVIPSYNNVKWCEKNILSTLNQNYDNYRVIFTDDCSADGTFERVSEIVNTSTKKDKFVLVKNTTRVGALANLYNMIHSCDDDEIVLTLDGDDWLANENVLNKLNEVYSSGDVWMTYGQYQNYPDGGRGVAQTIPQHVLNSSSFRQFTWCSTHLRTFYSWLFKNINKEDLCYDGRFMSMTWDMAMMFPMLEMSGNRSRFIDDVLYTYNMDNPINDHKVNIKLQQDLDRYVRRLTKYQKLDKPLGRKRSIGLILISTGKYHEYIQGLISSADSYFLKGMDVTYYLLSDAKHEVVSGRPVVQLPIEHRPWPYPTLERFKNFTTYSEVLSKEKYLFYVDVDCLFVDHVSPNILGDLVGVQHCGYYNQRGPVETNNKSVFYADPGRYRYYFGGGFSGGKSEKYLALARWCAEMINTDLNNGVMPLWHDETALNRYFLDHFPDVVLNPSYHYPQTNLNHYRSIWNCDFKPKIMLLDKNHGDKRQ